LSHIVIIEKSVQATFQRTYPAPFG